MVWVSLSLSFSLFLCVCVCVCVCTVWAYTYVECVMFFQEMYVLWRGARNRRKQDLRHPETHTHTDTFWYVFYFFIFIFFFQNKPLTTKWNRKRKLSFRAFPVWLFQNSHRGVSVLSLRKFRVNAVFFFVEKDTATTQTLLSHLLSAFCFLTEL